MPTVSSSIEFGRVASINSLGTKLPHASIYSTYWYVHIGYMHRPVRNLSYATYLRLRVEDLGQVQPWVIVVSSILSKDFAENAVEKNEREKPRLHRVHEYRGPASKSWVSKSRKERNVNDRL
jgi:hypothetical protein